MIVLTNFFDKMNFLYGIDEGKSIRQNRLESLYITKGINIEPTFHQAFDLTKQDATPPHFRGRGWWAHHMNWYAVGLLRKSFSDLMDKDDCGRPFLILDKHVRIYFKKLNNKYMPDNIVTKHVRDMNTMSLKFDDDTITVLYAGFRVNKNWDEILGCNLVEMQSLNEPCWISDLTELGEKMISDDKVEVRPITPPVVIPDEITVTGKLRKTQKPQKKAE
ncbi:MAG: hypothetical protein DHS20C17_02140 [Cyclobacteriaceae bacterium]|nr:MAG: hypothetical protein DHS20C17_02140 [Cyclobacteriaceae bacterium]